MWFVITYAYDIVVSNSDRWDLRRWSISKLQEEIKNRNISEYNEKMKREDLVILLNDELCKEASNKLANNENKEDLQVEETGLMDVNRYLFIKFSLMKL